MSKNKQLWFGMFIGSIITILGGMLLVKGGYISVSVLDGSASMFSETSITPQYGTELFNEQNDVQYGTELFQEGNDVEYGTELFQEGNSAEYGTELFQEGHLEYGTELFR